MKLTSYLLLPLTLALLAIFPPSMAHAAEVNIIDGDVAGRDVGAFELSSTVLPPVLLTVAGTGPFQNQLMVVNPDTCSAKPIGVTQDSSSGPVRRIRGLAYASGELYGVTREGDIVKVDRFSGTTTLLGTVGSSLTEEFWSGLALDPTGMDLYAVNAGGTHNLARFTLPAGPAVQIGPIDFNTGLLGLAFVPGVTSTTMYGANRGNNNILEISSSTGAVIGGGNNIQPNNRQQITVHPGTNELWGITDGGALHKIISPFSTWSTTPICELPFWIIEILSNGQGGYGWGGLAFVPDDYNVAWTSCTTLGITCNDNNPCTDDVCDSATGVCSNPPKPIGASCDDGNACTQTDTCQPGQGCVGATSVTCDDDNNPCTDDCDPATGLCSYPESPTGTWCDDGNECTQTDACIHGHGCRGVPVTCTASDQCHDAGTCDPSTGACSNPPKAIGTSCDDGNVCTLGDSCQAFSTGGYPFAALIQGTDRALYGTANQGGSNGVGTVFKLNRDGTGFTILVNFADYFSTGYFPAGALLQGTDGALYGTTSSGGTGGSGTVFKLDGNVFSVLWNFDGSTTGRNPDAGLLQGTDGALYGTTHDGGSNNYGTVFKLDGNVFSVLKNFDGFTTGGNPETDLIQGTDGALYGTTSRGGSSTGSQVCPLGCGTVFKLDGNVFSVLWNFDGSTTGRNPAAGLLQGTDGALYGTTSQGGSNGGGTVFKLDGNVFSVLWNFDGTMGRNPRAGLIQGTDGALYGTTSTGGSNGAGTVFKLDPITFAFTVLMNFDGATTGGNLNGLIQGPGPDYALYGTTLSGGSNGGGTVFKLNPDGTDFAVLAHLSLASDRGCSAGTATITCDDNSPCTDDSCDPAAGCVHTTVTDTTPPTISCPANVTSECQSAGQGIVSLPLATAFDTCSGPAVITSNHTPSGADASGSYPLGDTTVTFTASDGSGNTATCRTVVRIIDTTPPSVTPMSMSPATIGPPNHKMIEVLASYTATDSCSPVTCALSTKSSEPDFGTGGGDLPGDVFDKDATHVELRKERANPQIVRTYTTTVTCKDSSNNAAPSKSAVVKVVNGNSGNGSIMQPGTAQVDPVQP